MLPSGASATLSASRPGSRVGRWVAIDTALAFLAPADRASEDSLLEAGVASGLVTISTGPIAQSIRLTEAGVAACRAMADPERKKPARR